MEDKNTPYENDESIYELEENQPKKEIKEPEQEWQNNGENEYNEDKYYEDNASFGSIDQNPYFGEDPDNIGKKISKMSLEKKMGMTIGLSVVLSILFGIGGGIFGYNFIKGTFRNSQLQIPYSDSGVFQTEPKTVVAQVAKNVGNSVVEITTEVVSTDNRFRQYVTEGAGSGVIISEDGYIVTNNHVIKSAQKITITLKDERVFDAALVATDPKTDIAVIKIPATGLSVAIFGDSDMLQVGEQAIAVGNPLGQLGGTVTEGIISALNRDITIDGETRNLLQTNAAINPGNSGGGFFNANSELIGLVVAKTSGTGIEGLGFAIPSNEVKSIAEELVEYGYVRGRIDLQMSLIDITSLQQAIMYGVQQTGVYVSKVNSGSEAESTGFQQGDKIVEANSKAVNSLSELQMIIDKLNVGDSVKFIVQRNSKQVDVNLTLQEYKPSL